MPEESPSQTLIRCVENFGEDEPDVAVVLWTTKSGNIAWTASACSLATMIGMLETAKVFSLRQVDGKP